MSDRLIGEVERLRAAIRKHRDQRGDDRCWKDNDELYAALPEGHAPVEHDTLVELENCRRYIASCHDPRTEYVSPQREIERLQAAIATLNDRWQAAIGMPLEDAESLAESERKP